jgi:hypothetical protein
MRHGRQFDTASVSTVEILRFLPPQVVALLLRRTEVPSKCSSVMASRPAMRELLMVHIPRLCARLSNSRVEGVGVWEVCGRWG